MTALDEAIARVEHVTLLSDYQQGKHDKEMCPRCALDRARKQERENTQQAVAGAYLAAATYVHELTPADAQRALDKLVEEKVRAAKLESARMVSTILDGTAFDFRVQKRIHDYIAALTAPESEDK